MTELPEREADRDRGTRFSGRLRPLLALGGVFGGVALLLNIVGGISLNIALLAMSALMLAILAGLLRIASPESRRWILLTIAAGIGSGFVATLAYDAAKTGLSQLDPSPYNPFHAVTAFGTLIVGTDADPALVLAAGTAFHLLNGTSFGVAYAFLFARDGRTALRWALLTGIGWGLFLETFQLTLYPGWLDIRLYREFATISALSHVVYGATLGLLARAILPHLIRQPPDP
ncbi:MAG: hypothetical protein M3R32_06415 [Chloroflexota bacterium]|nr:hypothetical protein [Chloroflexota bacterium]